jgi:hypothetical protein
MSITIIIYSDDDRTLIIESFCWLYEYINNKWTVLDKLPQNGFDQGFFRSGHKLY